MSGAIACALYYFRARHLGSTVLLLAVLTLVTGLWVHLGAPGDFAAATRILPAMAALAIIGVQAEGPCQVVEQIASTRLAALRLAHQGGLLIAAGAALLLASHDPALARDTLGLGGLFLVCAPFVESTLALLPALTLGTAGLLARPTDPWGWASTPITNWTAGIAAALAYGLGLLLYGRLGHRRS